VITIFTWIDLLNYAAIETKNQIEILE
jgi:hypothetical protein